MKLLLIKTSSLGDLFHTFPAISDIRRHAPGWEVTWVVEEGLAEVPAWHPGVHRVLPISLRGWRRGPAARAGTEIREFVRQVRRERFDAVVDAQGLLKSAWVAGVARKRDSFGYSWRSAREPLASLLVRRRIPVARELHAILRTRILVAAALGYRIDEGEVEYAIGDRFRGTASRGGLVFLIGASWESKLWGLDSWRALARRSLAAGRGVTVLWGTEEERERASALRADVPGIQVPSSRTTIPEVAALLANADGIVGPDTGFTHLGAALDVPTVALFGPTSPRRTGVLGRQVQNLAPEIDCHPCHKRICPVDPADPPCHHRITPERVWSALSNLLAENPGS